MKNRNVILAGLLLSPALILGYLLNGCTMQSGYATQQMCNLAFAASWLCLTAAMHNIRKKHRPNIHSSLEVVQVCLLASLCLLHLCQIVLPAFDQPSAAYSLNGCGNVVAAVFILVHLFCLRTEILNSFSAAITFFALLVGSVLWLNLLWVPGSVLAAVTSFTLATVSFGYRAILEQAASIEQENLLYELSTL